MMTPQKKRCAIVGTAESWKDTPWDDPSLEIWSLNDAYSLNGFQRADRWFELHPTDKFYFRPKQQRAVYAELVPPGHYVRPEGHMEWLREQARQIPVYLQNDPPKGWPPNAKRFPIEDAKARFGDYWASGPSYMVALAIMEGFEEIRVYGIHLATDHEYRDQRAQFEHILGIAKGLGITVYMAEKSPVMRHGWQYGYEPKPQPHPAKLTLRKLQHEQGALAKALVMLPRWANKAPQLDRLQRIEALMADCQMQLAHAHLPPVITIGG